MIRLDQLNISLSQLILVWISLYQFRLIIIGLELLISV